MTQLHVLLAVTYVTFELYMAVYKLLMKGSQFKCFCSYRKQFIFPSVFDNKMEKVKTGYFDYDKEQMIEKVIIK